MCDLYLNYIYFNTLQCSNTFCMWKIAIQHWIVQIVSAYNIIEIRYLSVIGKTHIIICVLPITHKYGISIYHIMINRYIVTYNLKH